MRRQQTMMTWAVSTSRWLRRSCGSGGSVDRMARHEERGDRVGCARSSTDSAIAATRSSVEVRTAHRCVGQADTRRRRDRTAHGSCAPRSADLSDVVSLPEIPGVEFGEVGLGARAVSTGRVLGQARCGRRGGRDATRLRSPRCCQGLRVLGANERDGDTRREPWRLSLGDG
jgi:hypothetical protein